MYVLLRGLPAHYTTIVQLIKMREKMELSECIDTLKNEEERNEHGQTRAASDQRVRFEAASLADEERNCYTCGKAGHIKFDCPRNQQKIKCYNCKRMGHSSVNCNLKSKELNYADVEFAC